MADFGIVCEYNPLHNGHIYLMNEARARGAERIICVMSGNAVQRGELAVADKYLRARIALESGADLVLELPYPYSAASAEYFAGAGISILSDFCDTVIFGSESGDISKLEMAADAVTDAGFKLRVKERTERGEGSAGAYFDELSRLGIHSLSSNDILGIEYIKAIKSNRYPMGYTTVRRKGADYNSESLTEGDFPSATAMRGLLSRDGITVAQLAEYMPSGCAEYLINEKINGGLTEVDLISAAVIAYFRLCGVNSLGDIAEAGGGLLQRIIAASNETATLQGLLSAVCTKRYTDARIRRAILFALTGVTNAMLDSSVAYTTLLAANEKGCAILSEKRRQKTVTIITKPADAPACAQRDVGERLEAIFSLARKKTGKTGDYLRKTPFLIK